VQGRQEKVKSISARDLSNRTSDFFTERLGSPRDAAEIMLPEYGLVCVKYVTVKIPVDPAKS